MLQTTIPSQTIPPPTITMNSRTEPHSSIEPLPDTTASLPTTSPSPAITPSTIEVVINKGNGKQADTFLSGVGIETNLATIVGTIPQSHIADEEDPAKMWSILDDLFSRVNEDDEAGKALYEEFLAEKLRTTNQWTNMPPNSGTTRASYSKHHGKEAYRPQSHPETH